MKTTICSLAIIICGCGARPQVDPELRPYVDHFNAFGTAMGVVPRQDFDVEFGKMESSSDGEDSFALAECRFYYLAKVFVPARVTVDRHVWALLNDEAKQLVISHELVHCGLEQQQHDPRDMKLMSESISSEDFEYITPSKLREMELEWWRSYKASL